MDRGPRQLSRMKTRVGYAGCLYVRPSPPKDQEGRSTKKLVLEFAIRLHSHNKGTTQISQQQSINNSIVTWKWEVRSLVMEFNSYT